MAKGKNKPKEITGGLYQGDAGAYSAKENPLAFFNHALANEGRTAFNTAPDAWNYLQNQGFENVYSGFQNALAGDKNLHFLNHMANTYGVSPSMSASNPYAGDSALAPVVVNQEWGTGGGRRRQRR